MALRSANLRIQGNGQGAVSPEAYLAELPSLVEEIDAGTIEINARRCRWPTSKPPGARPRLPACAPSSSRRRSPRPGRAGMSSGDRGQDPVG